MIRFILAANGFGWLTLISGTRALRLRSEFQATGPDFTLHDENHLSALWDRASQLLGQPHDFNPLETFIFGGAVLLHDAGHAVAAYEGGFAELKRTNEYRDAVAAVLYKSGKNLPSQAEIDNPSHEIVKSALFAAVRLLHAKQARILAARAFNGTYLIADKDVRENVAELIGLIAASHHWKRELINSELPSLRGARLYAPGMDNTTD